MSDTTKAYVGGEFVEMDGRDVLDIVNPANERPIGKVGLGGASDVDRAVLAACEAFPAFARTSREERLAVLDRVIAAYTRRLDELATSISDEMGAPSWFARKAHAPAGLRNLEVARDVLAAFSFEGSLAGTRICREPAGVCALITPWNWPINQIACKVGPALAAGCTMVLKPSELAPSNASLFAEIMHEAEVPAGVFNLVHGTGEQVGEALSRHPRVDVVSFTGSTRAGKAVAQAAGQGVKRVSLELGGKSANVVLASADLNEAVAWSVRQCFENSGQSCNAPSRMLVPEDSLDVVAALARETAERLRVGQPQQDGVDLGPVANRAQYQRVQALIDSALAEGATLLAGGPGRPPGLDQGFFVQPTVFTHVKNSMRIAQEEVFGPVLSILTYRTVDQAIALANDSLYGLSGVVWGEPDEALEVARQLRTGNVHLNGAPQNLAAPFGGYKQSGVGRERGTFGLEEFLETKAIYSI